MFVNSNTKIRCPTRLDLNINLCMYLERCAFLTFTHAIEYMSRKEDLY
jgi:hypothetical protein